MGLSGLTFAIVLVGWAAYLVSRFAARRDVITSGDETVEDPFADSMTIIRRSSDPFSGEADPDLEVSTPLTRAAARHEVRASYRLAARRRRNVVVVLLVATVGSVVLSLASTLVPWWVAMVPALLLVAFVGVARFSVVTLNRTLDARMERINSGWDEDTISFEVPADLRDDTDNEHSIELSGPVVPAGSLWDPIPVTAPTYVSKPMVPRTIRTIDLSMPVARPIDPVPVVAETRDDQPAVAEGLPRAVGE